MEITIDLSDEIYAKLEQIANDDAWDRTVSEIVVEEIIIPIVSSLEEGEPLAPSEEELSSGESEEELPPEEFEELPPEESEEESGEFEEGRVPNSQDDDEGKIKALVEQLAPFDLISAIDPGRKISKGKLVRCRVKESASGVRLSVRSLAGKRMVLQYPSVDEAIKAGWKIPVASKGSLKKI